MKKVLSTALLGIAMSTSVMAAGSGAYVAGDVGSYSYGGYSVSALAVSGGLKFTPNLAVEAGLVAPNSYNYVSGGAMYTFDHSVIKGAAVGILPVNHQIDLYGKLGLARVAWSDVGPGYSVRGSDINLMFGFGAQMNINPQFALRAQYEYYGNNVAGWYGGAGGGYYRDSTSMVSVGASYRF